MGAAVLLVVSVLAVTGGIRAPVGAAADPPPAARATRPGAAAAPAADAPGVTAALVAALADPDEDVRALAADLLGDGGGELARRALSRALRDRAQPPPVRAAAARSLGRLPDAPPALGPLARAVRDERLDWRVRAAAIEALGTLDAGATLRRLLAAPRARELELETPRGVLPFVAGDAAARRALAAGGDDPDPRVRRAALLLALEGRCAERQRTGPACGAAVARRR